MLFDLQSVPVQSRLKSLIIVSVIRNFFPFKKKKNLTHLEKSSEHEKRAALISSSGMKPGK